MKTYKELITLNKNTRGCYILDTIKGCSYVSNHENRGCYSDCYAKKIADRYGFNFHKTVNRNFYKKENQFYLFGFSDISHINNIIKKIKSIDMPFIRIGEMGDPSYNWEHTINICKEISIACKPIVIITKHWKIIPDYLLEDIRKLNLCINTSVSALDTEEQLRHKLNQFFRIKRICNSVLRIVSCDFNKENSDGLSMSIVQDELFKITPHIDTIFRPSQYNPFVLKNIINIKKVKFLRSKVIASVFKENTYFGMCNTCPDMCGINSTTRTH